jgi:hypothetical protein
MRWGRGQFSRHEATGRLSTGFDGPTDARRRQCNARVALVFRLRPQRKAGREEQRPKTLLPRFSIAILSPLFRRSFFYRRRQIQGPPAPRLDRADGSIRARSTAAETSAVLNFLLNPIFVFPKGA